jgi:hypothetical protein
MDWIVAFQTGGESAINTMVVNQFNQMFPKAKITNSQIVKTHFQSWPDAWYWLKEGAAFTNADIAIWALKPLVDEQVSLASDAYNPNRTTWSDGALKSSINTLNANFGLSLKCASVVPDDGSYKYIPFQDPSFDCPDTTTTTTKSAGTANKAARQHKSR